MNTPLVFILCIILFGLIVVYIIVTQHKNHTENILRQKKATNIAQYEKTLALITDPHPFPFSNTLLLCLHLRLLTLLQELFRLDADDDIVLTKINETQKKILDIQRHPTDIETVSSMVTDEDRQTIDLLKLIRKLTHIVNTEYQKGHINLDAFQVEKNRLLQIKIKISIDNVRRRISKARKREQFDMALQLIERALTVLDNKSDQYSEEIRAEFRLQQQQINNQRNAKFDLSFEQANDEDPLFQPRKKW